MQETLADLTARIEPLLGHSWLAAILVIVAGVLLAWLIQKLVARLLPLFTRRTRTDVDDKIAHRLNRPIFLTILVIALTVATALLELPARPRQITLRILSTLLVLIWLGAVLGITRILLDALSRVADRVRMIEKRTVPLVNLILTIALVGIAGYIVLSIWRIDATAWLASAGIVGIAVGFAAKDTLANLFSGFFILADAPYSIGDFLVLDTGERGLVTHIGMRSTRILTRDDVEITFPNAVIGNAKIINESGGRWEKRRLRIKVGVAYGSDLDQVCDVLNQVAADHETVLNDPPPRTRMRGFGDSSVDFELLCWIDRPVLKGKITHDLYMAVYKAFAEHGIEIPFPQRDIHLHPQQMSSSSQP